MTLSASVPRPRLAAFTAALALSACTRGAVPTTSVQNKSGSAVAKKPHTGQRRALLKVVSHDFVPITYADATIAWAPARAAGY